MSIPGFTNACFDPLINLYGDTTINEPDSSTPWPQTHVELVFIVFYIKLIYCGLAGFWMI